MEFKSSDVIFSRVQILPPPPPPPPNNPTKMHYKNYGDKELKCADGVR